MHITTQRLIIRPYQAEDARDVHAIFSDPVVMRDCEPAFSPEKSREALAHFITSSIACAVVLKAENKVICHLLFKQRPGEEDGIYEIGWIFNQSYWGQGYAHEAACAAIRFGFENLSVHKVMAETIDPVKSVGLMRKLGMKQEGIFRRHAKDVKGRWTDLYWYAILKTDQISSHTE